MTDVTVRALRRDEWGVWDQWLALQQWSSPFSASWWLDANCRVFGGYPLLLGAFRGDQLEGGLALRTSKTGPICVVRPSYIYTPIVTRAGGGQRQQQVLGAILEELEMRRLIVRPLKCTTDMVDLRAAVWRGWRLTASWTVLQCLKTWRVERDVSREELKQLRKSQRSGLVARVEPYDASVLYDLRRQTVLRHGTEGTLTRSQFQRLMDTAGSHGMQVVVRDAAGIPLSAGFVMWQGEQIAYDIWAGTSAAGLNQGAAIARYVLTLQELQRRGFAYFDWCDASYPGYSDFKLKFGGTMKVCLAVSREPMWSGPVTSAHVLLVKLEHILRLPR